MQTSHLIGCTVGEYGGKLTIKEENKPYAPRGVFREFFKCKALVILLDGPAGTGKTLAALNKIHVIMEKYPGARALIVRKERATLSQTTLVTFEDKVVPTGHPILLDGGSREHRSSYKYPNNSEIVLCGLDRPSKTYSGEYDIIFIDEAVEISQAQFESLLRALRHCVVPYQQIVMATNPDHPKHWLNTHPDLVRFVTRHVDNPWLHDGTDWTPAGKQYIEKVLGAYTGVRKLRMKDGIWASAEGIVFELFDWAVHVLTRAKFLELHPDGKFPAEWRRIVVIDFGFSAAFACLWIAIDHDGRAYVYREIHFTKRLVEDHAKDILKYSERENIEAYIADHADAEGRATLRKRGIDTLAANKDIEIGLQAVISRLKKEEDGKPRLYILEDCLVERDPKLVEAKLPTCLLEEIPMYVWDKKKRDGQEKEVPVDENNHSIDSLRYGMMHLEDGTILWSWV